MIRLSSNSTIFFKIFIPVFFTVFYGLFTIFLWLTSAPFLEEYPWLRLSNTIFYLAVVFILYKSIWQLKRVEVDKHQIVITDYKNAYRYSWESLDSMIITNYWIFRIVHFFFKEKTSFGRSVPFIQEPKGFRELEQKFPDISQHIHQA
jgi:hypothetical protein